MNAKRISVRSSFKTLPYKHEPKHSLHISTQTLYMAILKRCNELTVEKAVETGIPIKLPNFLSSFQVVKKKGNKPAIDWKTTKLLGTYTRYNNLHTRGYSAHFRWHKKDTKFKHSKLWQFKLTRKHKRVSMAKYFQTHGVNHLIEYRT